MLEQVETIPKSFNGVIKRLNKNGYIQIKVKSGVWIEEHRIVCEGILLRILEKNEVIHHINFDKTDNRPSNLAVFESPQAHSHWHRQHKQFGLTRPLQREIEKRMVLNLSLNS